VNPFSLIVGLGASFGLLRLIQNTSSKIRLRWLFTGLITLFGALIGARVGFVIAYSGYFKTHTPEIIQIAQGGLSWPGALVGAVLFAGIALALFKLPGLAGADRLSRMLIPVASGAWLGAWQAGIAYGQPLPAGTWGGMLIRDETGLTAFRFPLQPLAVLSLLLALGLCEWFLRKTKSPGVKTGVTGLTFSVHSLLFSFLRYDSVQTSLGFRLDTWAAAFFLAASFVFLLIVLTRSKSNLSVTEMEKNNET
jgi:prolipoprotein diacylglyceryltransferase